MVLVDAVQGSRSDRGDAWKRYAAPRDFAAPLPFLPTEDAPDPQMFQLKAR